METMYSFHLGRIRINGEPLNLHNLIRTVCICVCEVKEKGGNDDGDGWTISNLPHFPPLKEVFPSAVPLGSAGRSNLNTSQLLVGRGVWRGLDSTTTNFLNTSNPVILNVILIHGRKEVSR